MKSRRKLKKIQRDKEGSIGSALFTIIVIFILVGVAYAYVPSVRAWLNGAIGIEDSGVVNVNWESATAIKDNWLFDDKLDLDDGDTLTLADYDYIEFVITFDGNVANQVYITDGNAPHITLYRDGVAIQTELVDIVGESLGSWYKWTAVIGGTIFTYLGLGGENTMEDTNLNYVGVSVIYTAQIVADNGLILGTTPDFEITGA